MQVFVDASLEAVEKRDPKGLYKKARAGEIPSAYKYSSFIIWVFMIISDFTGITAPYEAPDKPEVHVSTDNSSVDDCVKQLVEYLQKSTII